MRYDPLAPDGGLFSEGVYEARTSAKEGKSAKGNPMITVTVTVFNGDDSIAVMDYWVSANKKNLASFCRATGQFETVFMAGSIDPSHINGRRVKVRLSIDNNEKGKTNRDGELYLPKNIVAEYLPSDLEDDPPADDFPPEEDPFAGPPPAPEPAPPVPPDPEDPIF